MGSLLDDINKRKWWFFGGFITGLTLYVSYQGYFAAQKAKAVFSEQAARMRMPTISGV
jgi:hypothetical protein